MQQISEKIVAGLPSPAKGNKVHFFSGATLQGKKAPSGFGVRVTSGGAKSFVLFHRHDGRKYLETLGRWDENDKGGSLSVRDAIVRAEGVVKSLGSGRREDPRPARTRRLQDGNKPEGMTVADMLDQFVERYCKTEANLRSADEIARVLKQIIKPAIGHLAIGEIRRSHVVKMLDQIADERGARMADLALAYCRKGFNWWAARDDEFQPPIVKGMARTKPKERARKRVLADDEIRDLWAALDSAKDLPTPYARYIRTLLLTATRRTEAGEMHVRELEGDIWTIPGQRYKTKMGHVVPLTAAALAMIGKVDAGFIFSTDKGETAVNGFSKAKDAIDAEIARIRKEAGRAAMDDWTFHDLHRTARSLMSRAGVPADHAERCLGHVIGGVRETYDRHEYLSEKRAGFEALAGIVNTILKGNA
jgi:integrase